MSLVISAVFIYSLNRFLLLCKEKSYVKVSNLYK